MDFDKTMNFKVENDQNVKYKEVLTEVYKALEEKGYNPVNDARNIIRKVERDELLEKMVKTYIGIE